VVVQETQSSTASKKTETNKVTEPVKKEESKEPEKVSKKPEPTKEAVKTINSTEIKKEKPPTITEAKEQAEPKAKPEKKSEDTGFIVTVKKTKKGQKYEILNAFTNKEQDNSASKGKSLIEEVDDIVKKEKGSKPVMVQERPFELQDEDFPNLEKPQKQPSVNANVSVSKKEGTKAKAQKMERVQLPQSVAEKPKPANNPTWNDNAKEDVKKVTVAVTEDFPALKEVYSVVAKTLETSKKDKSKIAGRGTWESQPKKEEKKSKPFDFDEEFPSL
jgi:hypothetical protein